MTTLNIEVAPEGSWIENRSKHVDQVWYSDYHFVPSAPVDRVSRSLCSSKGGDLRRETLKMTFKDNKILARKRLLFSSVQHIDHGGRGVLDGQRKRESLLTESPRDQPLRMQVPSLYSPNARFHVYYSFLISVNTKLFVRLYTRHQPSCQRLIRSPRRTLNLSKLLLLQLLNLQ